jgi:hypothetical protein
MLLFDLGYQLNKYTGRTGHTSCRDLRSHTVAAPEACVL